MANSLVCVPDAALFELYGDPKISTARIAEIFGVSVDVVYRRLLTNRLELDKARELRARRLHEYAIDQVFAEPERIVDATGNERIDPSHVALLKYRSAEASRLAGILDRRLADRQQVDVTHDASPLADYIAQIAARGSSIPIAGSCTRIEDEDDAGE